MENGTTEVNSVNAFHVEVSPGVALRVVILAGDDDLSFFASEGRIQRLKEAIGWSMGDIVKGLKSTKGQAKVVPVFEEGDMVCVYEVRTNDESGGVHCVLSFDTDVMQSFSSRSSNKEGDDVNEEEEEEEVDEDEVLGVSSSSSSASVQNYTTIKETLVMLAFPRSNEENILGEQVRSKTNMLISSFLKSS